MVANGIKSCGYINYDISLSSIEGISEEIAM